MPIYSPLPPELIWEGQENFCPKLHEIIIGNLTLEVESLGFNRARVVRLLSTDPAHYLSSLYQPGSILEFTPSSVFNPGHLCSVKPIVSIN